MQADTIWSKLRAVLVWVYLNSVLLVWNRGFHLFSWWTWRDYRDSHPDKLALSILAFGAITYFAIESQRGSGPKPRMDVERVSRAGTILLGVVFLWMFW